MVPGVIIITPFLFERPRMERIGFWRLALEILASVVGVTGLELGVRAAIARHSERVENVGWVQRLARISTWELIGIFFVSALVGSRAEVFRLAVYEGMYWASDVDKRLNPDNRSRRKPEGQSEIRVLPYK